MKSIRTYHTDIFVSIFVPDDTSGEYLVINEKFGEMQYCKDGVPHRDHGPAVILPNIQMYYNNGFKHRLDGPAVVFERSPHLNKYYCYGQLVDNIGNDAEWTEALSLRFIW